MFHTSTSVDFFFQSCFPLEKMNRAPACWSKDEELVTLDKDHRVMFSLTVSFYFCIYKGHFIQKGNLLAEEGLIIYTRVIQ